MAHFTSVRLKKPVAAQENPELTTKSCELRSDAECLIDLVHLARQSLGDKDLETDLLRLFAQQCEQIISQLAPDKGQTTARLCDLAHGLKGSARTIGAEKVANAAENYENLAKLAAPPQQMQAAYAVLSQAASDTRKSLADLLSE